MDFGNFREMSVNIGKDRQLDSHNNELWSVSSVAYFITIQEKIKTESTISTFGFDFLFFQGFYLQPTVVKMHVS